MEKNTRESVIVSVVNKCLDCINEQPLKRSEIVIILAQLLIYSGKSLTNKIQDIHSMDYDSLYKEYYSSKENDIGLGLVLNGAAMMTAIPGNDGAPDVLVESEVPVKKIKKSKIKSKK